MFVFEGSIFLLSMWTPSESGARVVKTKMSSSRTKGSSTFVNVFLPNEGQLDLCQRLFGKQIEIALVGWKIQDRLAEVVSQVVKSNPKLGVRLGISRRREIEKSFVVMTRSGIEKRVSQGHRGKVPFVYGRMDAIVKSRVC